MELTNYKQELELAKATRRDALSALTSATFEAEGSDLVEPRDLIFEAETKHALDTLGHDASPELGTDAIAAPVEPSSGTMAEEPNTIPSPPDDDKPVAMANSSPLRSTLLATWTWEEDSQLIELLNELGSQKSMFALSNLCYADVQLPPRKNVGKKANHEDRWRLLRAKPTKALRIRAALLIHLNEYLPVQLRLASEIASWKQTPAQRCDPGCLRLVFRDRTCAMLCGRELLYIVIHGDTQARAQR